MLFMPMMPCDVCVHLYTGTLVPLLPGTMPSIVLFPKPLWRLRWYLFLSHEAVLEPVFSKLSCCMLVFLKIIYPHDKRREFETSARMKSTHP